MEFIASPFEPVFDRFLEGIEDPCVICSPFVTRRPVSRLVAAIVKKRVEHSIRITLLTDISADHLVGRSTDLEALLTLADSVRHVTLVYLPRIHAKVYTSGTSMAIVTSANLTDGGLSKNLEYGVAFTDPKHVLRVRADAERYASLGGRLSRERLVEIDAYVQDLRAAIATEQRSIDEKMRQLTQEIQQRTKDELLRARVAGRSITGVFADTIIYILDSASLATSDIHERIREIHPDLCDDSFDRVIDGERFGKLWKHHVRNAQQQLKREKLIDRDAARGTWHRVPAAR